MKLRRFEALGLLPSKGMVTVYLFNVRANGAFWVERRRMEPERFIESYLPDVPWLKLCDIEVKYDLRAHKSDLLNGVISVNQDIAVKAAPHKIKRLMKAEKQAKLPKAIISTKRIYDELKARSAAQ